MASVLEYIMIEIIDLSIERIKDFKKRITPDHMMFAIRNDREITQLLKDFKIISLRGPQIREFKFNVVNLGNHMGLLTKPVIQRLLRRGGIKYISNLCYEELRYIILYYIKNVVKNLCSIKNNGSQMLNIKDLETLFKVTNENSFWTINKGVFKIKSSRKKKKSKEEAIVNQIKELQKNNFHLIPRSTFRKLIVPFFTIYNVKESKGNIRFSKDFLNIFQSLVELYVVNLAFDHHW